MGPAAVRWQLFSPFRDWDGRRRVHVVLDVGGGWVQGTLEVDEFFAGSPAACLRILTDDGLPTGEMHWTVDIAPSAPENAR